MRTTRTASGLIVRAPAKVNLFLEVLGKRPDGYHDLASLMVAVSLYDTLEFKEDRSGALALDLAPTEGRPAGDDRPALSPGPDNLILRAAELLRQRTGQTAGARVRLHKRIPLAAGLAGGSSDAAATLIGLNALWRLGLSRTELAALGAEIGSDVPFFLVAPAAWCTGRGEVVTPLKLGAPLWLVLACPPAGLSTAAVFKELELSPTVGQASCLPTEEAGRMPAPPAVDGTALRQAAERGDVEEIGRSLFNRLQPVAERLCPAVAAAARCLERCEAAGRLMSGSGTTLFALCRSADAATRLAADFAKYAREQVPRTFVVRSCF